MSNNKNKNTLIPEEEISEGITIEQANELIVKALTGLSASVRESIKWMGGSSDNIREAIHDTLETVAENIDELANNFSEQTSSKPLQPADEDSNNLLE